MQAGGGVESPLGCATRSADVPNACSLCMVHMCLTNGAGVNEVGASNVSLLARALDQGALDLMDALAQAGARRARSSVASRTRTRRSTRARHLVIDAQSSDTLRLGHAQRAGALQ